MAKIVPMATSHQGASGGNVSAISQATEEQHKTRGFIASNIESISSLAEQSQQALQQAAQAAQTMAGQARDLQAEMEKFKI